VFLSQGHTITESDVVSFGAWSWDTNPVHTDAVFAENGRFDGRIAHGLSVCPSPWDWHPASVSSSPARSPCWALTNGGSGGRCCPETRCAAGRDPRHPAAQQKKCGDSPPSFPLLNQREEELQAGEIGVMVSVRPQG
jgi:hypothetical protein